MVFVTGFVAQEQAESAAATPKLGVDDLVTAPTFAQWRAVDPTNDQIFAESVRLIVRGVQATIAE